MAYASKNYELAYIFSPSVSEGEVLTYAGKINTLVEEAKGVIKRAEEPKKRLLAYPVKKQKSGYFGWITFSLAPSELKILQKKIMGHSWLLRCLLTEEEVEKYPALIRPLPSRRIAPKVRPLAKREETKPEEKLDLEALDKKLEEILGK